MMRTQIFVLLLLSVALLSQVAQSALQDVKICRPVGNAYGTQVVPSSNLPTELRDGSILPKSRVKCFDYDDNCAAVDATGASCPTGLIGPCASGSYTCNNDRIVCTSTWTAGPELCDGIDNDCDGTTDETYPEENSPCDLSPNLSGLCATGQRTCVAGTLGCEQITFPVSDICGDNLDNDCDGTVDNDDSVCNDGDACTTDTCTAGTGCAYAAVVCPPANQCFEILCDPVSGCSAPQPTSGGSCNDNDPCTLNDVCSNGQCAGTPMTCTSDGNACHSAAYCSAGECIFDPLSGNSCDDGDACTQTDTCSNGECVGSNPVVCTASDECHVVGTCDSQTGVCSNPNAEDETCCSDNDVCSVGDTCQNGVCIAGEPAVCGGADQCHSAGACDPLTGCADPVPLSGGECDDGDFCTVDDVCDNGVCRGTPRVCPSNQCQEGVCSNGACGFANIEASCDDGLYCTENDTCNNGQCEGTPVTCTASDECHTAGVCEEETQGVCTNPVGNEGACCFDGDLCTEDDTCQNGVCIGGPAATCFGADQCNAPGTCDPLTGCTDPTPLTGGSCNDEDACTENDTCNNGQCAGTPKVCAAVDECHAAGECDAETGTCTAGAALNSGSCDDGLFCTENDVCSAGVCQGTPKTCTVSDQCHVAGVCEEETQGQCTNPNAEDDTCCLDDSLCTSDDKCQNGICVSGPAVTCGGADQCHTAGSCDPLTGCSEAVPVTGGTCDDEDPCTENDTCNNGQCAGTPKVCGAIDECHAAGTCDTETGTCTAGAALNSGSCDDGLYCTENDACSAGVCQGTPKTCTASDQCHVAGVCEEETQGECTNPNAGNGVGCSDGDVCTENDTCQNGACISGAAITCTGADQCNSVGACDAVTGCPAVTPLSGNSCDDGDACTQTDTCSNGECVGSNPVVCTASDECHVVGECNPSTGECSNPNAPDDTCCYDNSLCTADDKCQNGVCVSGPAVTCGGIDQCHTAGSCDPLTGCADPVPVTGGTCDDEDPCTENDTCNNGECAGTPVVCPGNACREGVCNAGVCGLGEPRLIPQSCSDDNACTLNDACVEGECVGEEITCSAFDQCHVAGECNPSTGECTNPNADNGVGCSDEDVCTANDTCQNGACVSGAAITCSAGDTCNEAATCDPVTGCSAVNPLSGNSCDDGDACTENDTCNSGQCAGTPKVCAAIDQCHAAGTCDTETGTCTAGAALNSGSCDDGLYCTENDVCSAGVCQGTPKVCTASDQCHVVGVCEEETQGQCTNPNAVNGLGCTDGDVCTANDSCQEGACISGAAITCAGADQCNSVGACNAVTGCPAPVPLSDIPCNSDNDLCTVGDSCDAGTCVPGAATVCTAADECHEPGTCEPSTGICSVVNAQEGKCCSDGDLCTENDTCNGEGVCVAGTAVTCSSGDQCHVAATCNSATGCPTPLAAEDGTECVDGLTSTADDVCTDGVCAGTPCSFANASPNPNSPSCVFGFCDPDYADCDGMPSTGCEIHLKTSNNNCGACGNICGIGSTCIGGICAD